MGQAHYKPPAPGGVCANSRNRAGRRCRPAWANPAQGGLIRSRIASIATCAMSPRCGGRRLPIPAANDEGQRGIPAATGGVLKSRGSQTASRRLIPGMQRGIGDRAKEARINGSVAGANLMSLTIAPAARNGCCDGGFTCWAVATGKTRRSLPSEGRVRGVASAAARIRSASDR